ncbi:periplasmic heavy metal sensor [Myxococcus sp. K15C18031901]|uniref:Spy/CpxP family protein refolding chaperone n=1 Tax=Myxococcus dinghuensis TaxID=2906761 RepID=UPI0020A6E074|nr:periplasmic heavy metal sensor [Myxococcus dinghuensis]MCP3098706.1 periplasmic heavy metal sensor [Myxococcus dinghuensis]
MFGFVFGTACLAGLFYTMRGGRHWRHHPGGRGARWGWRFRLRWLFERLETSPGQEKVIIQAAEEVFEAFSKLRDQVRPSRTTLGAAMRGEHFDGAAVRELFTQHDVALEEARRVLQGALAQVHEALDPRQRRELADLLEHGWGHGWRGEHGWRGGPGWHGRHCGGRGRWHDDDRRMV